MKKITTLFKKDPNNLGRVIDEIDIKNAWAISEGIPTRKYDGTACAIIEGKLYKRFQLKKGRILQPLSIIADEENQIYWVLCIAGDPSNKWHFEAFDNLEFKDDCTYELCGEKVQGNPDKIKGHQLIEHGYGSEITSLTDRSFSGIKKYLSETDIEGIVFHHYLDGRMCKIRKKDFGIKR